MGLGHQIPDRHPQASVVHKDNHSESIPLLTLYTGGKTISYLQAMGFSEVFAMITDLLHRSSEREPNLNLVMLSDVMLALCLWSIVE
jgi:hypothetical protein